MNKYDDIININHHEPSSKHPRMSIENRAAIFAPFAALTGYSSLVEEKARLTDDEIYLTDDEKSILDEKLQYINSIINNHPLVLIEYFVKDNKKDGGKYLTHTGNIKKIDIINKNVAFKDTTTVNINDIINVEILEV